MATGKKETESGTLERLSRRGEETLTRIVDELGRNERVTEALGVAMSAKGKLDGASRRALGQVGLAAADELEDLRTKLARLEKRVAKLESGSKAKPAAGRKATTARTTARAKKTAGTTPATTRRGAA